MCTAEGHGIELSENATAGSFGLFTRVRAAPLCPLVFLAIDAVPDAPPRHTDLEARKKSAGKESSLPIERAGSSNVWWGKASLVEVDPVVQVKASRSQ